MEKQFAKLAPKLAVVGVGAVSESFYLPAIAKHEGVAERVVLVDVNQDRVKAMAKKFGISRFVFDYKDVVGEVDGAIIALPHHLHAKVSVDFLRHGAHVLCEKPLADNLKDAEAMVAESKGSGKLLLVNNMRRLFPGLIKAKELIDKGVIGDSMCLHAEEGFQYDWPTVSGFYFKQDRGGVLGDTGAHVIDIFCWWFGREPKVVSYQDDSFGGNEALAVLELDFGKKLKGYVKLSRFKRLSNKYLVQGTKGSLVCDLSDWRLIEITLDTEDGRTKISPPMAHKSFEDLGYAVVKNFVDVIGAKNVKPTVEGKDVLDSIAVLDKCYATRERFDMPWMSSR